MEFEEHLKKYLSENDINALLKSLNLQRTGALLLNTDKIASTDLINLFPHLKHHTFVDNCFLYDPSRDTLGKSIYHELGAFYLLEPCSVLVSHYLAPKKDDVVLDMCASPGGKSIHASLLMENQGLLISNDVSSSRANILSFNVERLGRKNIVVTNEKIDFFSSNYEEYFDKIILDAPCSGSGMFRKDEKMKEDWSYNKVLSLQKIQKELIIKAYSMLKPGGRMTYSTCSYSYEENEEVIYYLLENTDAKIVMIPQDDNFYRSDMKEAIHLFPHLINGEGHFIALIEKPGQITPSASKFFKSIKLSFLNECFESDYLYANSNDIYALSRFFKDKKIHIIRGGLKLGSQEKFGFVYDHALSHYLNTFSFVIDLSKEELKQYYQGSDLNTDVKQDGFALLRYQGIGVDFAKVVKGKIKNYLPKGLRKNF